MKTLIKLIALSISFAGLTACGNGMGDVDQDLVGAWRFDAEAMAKDVNRPELMAMARGGTITTHAELSRLKALQQEQRDLFAQVSSQQIELQLNADGTCSYSASAPLFGRESETMAGQWGVDGETLTTDLGADGLSFEVSVWGTNTYDGEGNEYTQQVLDAGRFHRDAMALVDEARQLSILLSRG